MPTPIVLFTCKTVSPLMTHNASQRRPSKVKCTHIATIRDNNTTLCLIKSFHLLTVCNFVKSTDFQNFCTAGKRMKFATKPIRQYSHHLRHVATLPWEIKNSNSNSDVEDNANRVHFFIASNFVIHTQILIFSVFKKRVFMLIVNKIFHVTVLLLIYFHHQFVPAMKKTLRQLMT